MAPGRYHRYTEARQTTRACPQFAPNRINVYLVETVGANAGYATSVVDGHLPVVPPGTDWVQTSSGDRGWT